VEISIGPPMGKRTPLRSANTSWRPSTKFADHLRVTYSRKHPLPPSFRSHRGRRRFPSTPRMDLSLRMARTDSLAVRSDRTRPTIFHSPCNIDSSQPFSCPVLTSRSMETSGVRAYENRPFVEVEWAMEEVTRSASGGGL